MVVTIPSTHFLKRIVDAVKAPKEGNGMLHPMKPVVKKLSKYYGQDWSRDETKGTKIWTVEPVANVQNDPWAYTQRCPHRIEDRKG